MRARSIIWAVAGTAAAATILACSAPSPSNTGGGTARDEPVKASVNPSISTSPPGPYTAFMDGTYEVGTGPQQVKPGKYTTTVEGYNCYWARLKGLSGETSDIITNGNIRTGAQGIITIKPTDKGFLASGGCEWKLSV